MKETYRGCIRTGIGIIYVLLAVPLISLPGCSTTATAPFNAQAGSTQAVGTLGEPQIQMDDQATVVELPFSAINTYSATRANEPERLVIELPGVDATQLAPTFPGKPELVDEIRIQAQPRANVPHTTVEVLLKKPSDYQIEQGTNSLRITFREEKKADHVLGVQAQDKASDTEIQIAGNGKFVDYRVRKVGNNRLAVDLSNIKSQAPQAVIPTTSGWVKRLHLDGSRAGRVTLLAEFSSPFAAYSVDNPGNALVLKVSSRAATSKLETPSITTPVATSTLETPTITAPVATSKLETPTITAPAPPIAEDSVKSFSPPPPGPAPVTPVAFKTAAVPRAAVVRQGPPTLPLTKTFVGKPISLDLQEAEIKNVLRLLADVSGTNIVIEPDVEGKVTLKVNRVPWDQVLDMILAMNNLGQEQTGGVIRIARLDKLKRELTEKDADLKARQQVLESSKDIGDIATNYLQVNYAQAAQIASKIDRMKSAKGKITVDERTNLILYSDYPAYIQGAKELLAKLDQPTPQVLIEARIVQLNANAVRDLGVDWSFDFSHLNNNSSHRVTNNYQINHPVAATSLMGFGIGQIAGQTLWGIDLKLSALEQAGKGKIVSAPRVLTLDNIEATIIQGQQIPYLKLNEFGVATTEFKDATLELKVIPHITPDQKVRLEIRAKKEQANFTQVIGTNAAPAIDTRRIATELLVADSDTIVIGGVIEEDESYSEDRTPGLSQVPLLGGLFKSEKFRKTKNELLIFISPRITGLSVPVRPKKEAFSPAMGNGSYPAMQ